MSAVETADLRPGQRISRIIKGGWQLAGDSDVRLDHVYGALPEKVDELLRSFVRERLGVEVPESVQRGPSVEIGHASLR